MKFHTLFLAVLVALASSSPVDVGTNGQIGKPVMAEILSEKPVTFASYWNNWFRSWLYGNDVPEKELGSDERNWLSHAKMYADDK